MLYAAKFKPTVTISEGVYLVHGMTNKELGNENTLTDEYEKTKSMLTNRKVLIFNASFDDRLIAQSLRRYNLQYINYESFCIMEEMMYYHNSNRYISLESWSGENCKA